MNCAHMHVPIFRKCEQALYSGELCEKLLSSRCRGGAGEEQPARDASADALDVSVRHRRVRTSSRRMARAKAASLLMADGEEEDEEGDSDEEDLMAMDFRPGQIAREETLERLRMLRRWGILRNSKQTFEVSRTGKPSLALRYVARVLSMNRFQFRRLLAADAYERGERDDQEGAYSDEEDEDDDGFGDYKPLTVEQVWNGDTFLTGETPDSNRLLGMTTE